MPAETAAADVVTVNMNDDCATLTIKPIGVIRTAMRLRFEAPHQPDASRPEKAVIHLLPDRGFERALRDLEGFERIWLLWWFHRSSGWRPLVRPPRGAGQRRGTFATRAPHRPNPLGLSCVQLRGIAGLQILIGSCDLLDGTPILDIKPYLSAIDAFPDSRSGWVEEVEADTASPPRYCLIFSPTAAAQLAWLRERWNIDFMTRAAAILERDPAPHRTRRIYRFGSERFRMGCGPWRIVFSVEDEQVLVERVARGYPLRLLRQADAALPDKAAQAEFELRWPEQQP